MTGWSIAAAPAAGLVLIGALAATTADGGLRALMTPSDFDARQAALEANVRTAERLMARPGDGSAFPSGTVCDGFDADTIEQMRLRLQTAASAEGLVGTQIVWGQPSDISGKITPIALRIEAEGSYQGVTAYIDRLARGAPQIFVDTADLRGRGDLTRLSLSGKVFCWTGG